MGTLSLRLSESVHSRVRELARKDGVSANQFIATAIAEKAAAMLALEGAAGAQKTSLGSTLSAVLAGQPDVIFGYLFGSQATGAAGPRSDVDVAIYLAPGVDAFESRLRVLGDLQTALGTDAVDLLILNTAPIAIAGRALTTRRVLVDTDPPVRHRYESLTAREFADFRIREHRLLPQMNTDGRRPQVDRDLVLRRTLTLEQYLCELAEVVAPGKDAYLADWKIQRAAERTLQLAIELCLDLADHLIADHRLPVPDTAAGSFETLRAAKLLEPQLATALMRMARFRNLLVHDYVRLDAAKVFDIASHDVADIKRFATVMQEQLI